MLARPVPPSEMLEIAGPSFAPSRDLEDWARATFIDPEGDLANEEHAHLQHARIGFAWAAVPNARNGMRIVGQCEKLPPMAMGRWARARAEMQMQEWFGYTPDFLITIDAHYAAQVDDVTFCSTIEHELGHAGQERDPYGAPKFTKAGLPKFAIRGHDVEEFVFVVRRYGVAAAAGATAALVQAANEGPTIGQAAISQACGTCRMLKAA